MKTRRGEDLGHRESGRRKNNPMNPLENLSCSLGRRNMPEGGEGKRE